MRIPFGRFMLFFLITGGRLRCWSSVLNQEAFSLIYMMASAFSLLGAVICFVLWLAITLFCPSTLLEPGRSFKGLSYFADGIFYDIPWFRISILSLVISGFLFAVSPLVFSIGITISVVSFEMSMASLLFFTYGSGGI